MGKKVKITQTGKDSTAISKFKTKFTTKAFVAGKYKRAVDEVNTLRKKVDSLQNRNDSLHIKLNEKK